MRYGFAGRGFQHVPCIVFDPADCRGAHGQFPEWEERPGTWGALVSDSASGKLAACLRIPGPPGSEPLQLGAARLGRDVARGLAGDEAHHRSKGCGVVAPSGVTDFPSVKRHSTVSTGTQGRLRDDID